MTPTKPEDALVERLDIEQRKALLQTDSWSGQIAMSPTLRSLEELGLLVSVVTRRDGLGAKYTVLGYEVARILARAALTEDKPEKEL